MKLTLDRKLTPAEIADAFCELDDERQAQVFIEIAALAQTWGTSPSMQWFYIGKHLRDCACSTWEARDMVKEIAEVLEAKP